MKRLLWAAAIAAVAAVPIVAHAQATPNAGGPPPEMRAQMDKIRGDERTAAFNALSPDHRSRVQAIVDQVAAGKSTDAHASVQQIDAILTPDESKAVLASAQKARDDMRAYREANGMMGGPPRGAAPNGGPPGGAPPNGTRAGGPGMGGGMRGMRNDPGFVLLMSSLTPEQMRAAMPRPSTAP